MAAEEFGNKAINLRQLKKMGFRVPDFISFGKTESEESLLKTINDKFKGSLYFAVRSSSYSEDSSTGAKAGYYYSAVGVEKSELFTQYLKVLESLKEDDGGVIIQEFIPSDKSGVIFTGGGEGQAVINANFGLCKNVVEGKPCDEYVLTKTGKIQKQYIADNKPGLYFRKGNFETGSSDLGSLSEKEIRRLFKEALMIEKHFGSAQDIEWCFYRSGLFILQSRPVTRELPSLYEEYFDSANIAESYSGIVLPLTLSFAAHIYKIVYENLVIASGASRRKVENNSHIFNNMVSWHYGRLYYNMNNWYKMTSFIPGYSRNKANLEDMITSNIRADIPRDILPSVWLKLAYPLIVIFKVLFLGRKMKLFKGSIDSLINKYRQIDFEALDLHASINLYKDLNSNLLSRWHIPVENDFMVMTYYGALKKRLSEKDLNLAVRFESETGKQIKALYDLNEALMKVPATRDAILKGDSTGFESYLKTDNKLQKKYNEYFMLYGGRFANELKLESSDIEEDTGKFLDLLRLYNKLNSHKGRSISIDKAPAEGSFLLSQFKKYAAKREEMRLLRSRAFSLVRKTFNRLGSIYTNEKRIDSRDDIYYLTVEEVLEIRDSYLDLIKLRKNEYKEYLSIEPPAHFSSTGKEVPINKDCDTASGETLEGRPCTPGKIRGRVKVFREYFVPEKIDFDIIVARHTDPGWTALLGLCKGLIVEHGGILSHAAIVSRELGIPTVIGIQNATILLKDNQLIELDGSSGLIIFLNDDNS